MSTSIVEYIPIRQNGSSLFIRIPAHYVRKFRLARGDIAIWEPTAGKLQIVRKEKVTDIFAGRELKEEQFLAMVRGEAVNCE